MKTVAISKTVMVNGIQTGAKAAEVITVDSREELAAHEVEIVVNVVAWTEAVEVDNSAVINEALVIVVVIRTVASNNKNFNTQHSTSSYF